jgi:hypothetical protein
MQVPQVAAMKLSVRHNTVVYAIIVLLCVGGCAAPTKPGVPGADHAPDEKAAVLAAVDRCLGAMSARDTKAYAAAITPDGMTYSQRWVDGKWHLRRRSNQQDIDMLDDESEAISEAYWEPTVLIRGPLAVVWAPYEFRRDGKVSHCGVDVFEMLKLDGRWVMGNAMWTVEPGACDELQPRSATQKQPVGLTIR